MEFSEKLKQLRSEKGISQAKLAADIHISRSAVAKWENGLGLPNDESIKLLADYFGITIDELITNKSNEEILVSKNKTIDQQKKVI
ncbi:MAG: helix-turn-helix transcriptional regulator, partial [Clostridia bacterium]|nr:helix-turn-helix transcriptional regulator [Clostridia bacterium]